jgi:hypothetical protein
VGVETAKGSWLAEVDEFRFERERDPLKEFELEDGRSSNDGGGKPSSLCNQSICINVVDS